MKPEQTKLLISALEKFELLTYRQIAEIFRGQIQERSVRRCIARVTKSGLIKRHQFSVQKNRLYTYHTTPFLVLQKLFDENPERIEFQFHHREACTDVMIALARRAFVTKVITEHELRKLPFGSPVIDRRPDGLFVIERRSNPSVTAAIEVETTLRNFDRIRHVVSKYVQTFTEYPHRLSGVLIVTATPNIARAYRVAIDEVSEKIRGRFLLSEKIDISDVKETILGWAFVPLLENPNCPLIDRSTRGQLKPLKTEPTTSR